MTQLFAAATAPAALKAIAPAMVGYHPDTDWAYENGALLLQAGVGWAIQLAAETARLRGDHAAFQALYRASRQLPIHDETPACPTVLSQYAPDSFFHDWLQHPQPDEYWQTITPQLDHVDLPMLHIGGWFDPYLRGDLRLYQEMTARSQFPQPLWIGPWGHIPWGRKVGARDFGAAAENPIDRLQVDWFKHWLAEESETTVAPTGVNLFEMGGDRWRQFETWPSGERQCWYLTSQGLAAMRQDDGGLTQVAPATTANRSLTPALSEAAIDTLVHDPWRPVPSLGGHAAIPSGAFDRSAIDCRSDVLTYTSPILEEPLHVAGQIEMQLRCWSDRPSFDLSITLSEVRPDHTVYPLTQGYGRFQQAIDGWQTVQLPLQPTCFVCTKGNALRVSISAASFPAYAVNPGTGETAAKSRVIDSEITTIRLKCGDRATCILLPVC
jgi:hypothetical protein